ncbi:hypothetical protein AAG612_07030 [Citromicrobium bathyomarinum]|uniref:hypothetical protein n=1 Tax=Citromicrobium bathyomarinum TaxID=72174 RepID=UPI00315B2E40
MGTSGWFGIALILMGAFTVFTAAKSARDAQQRLQSGKDRYFEERRELEAYPQLRNPSKIKRGGWFVMASGVVLVTLDVFVVS